MIDTPESAVQITVALSVFGCVFFAKRKPETLLAFACIVYWLLVSITQEIFNTNSPSTITFFLALGVALSALLVGRHQGSRWPLIFASIFTVIMLCDAFHYFTAMIYGVPKWNRIYQDFVAFLYYLSLLWVIIPHNYVTVRHDETASIKNG